MFHILNYIRTNPTTLEKQRTSGYFKSLNALFLLVLFSTYSFKWDVSHLYKHSEINLAVHSHEAEQNACHLALYHKESTHGCHHKIHFSQKELTCDVCLSLVKSQFERDLTQVLENKTELNFLLPRCQKSISDETEDIKIPSRAPPFFI